MNSSLSSDQLDETTPLTFSPNPSGGGDSDKYARLSTNSKHRRALFFSSSAVRRDVLDGTFNLVNTIIGGGMLALPFALKTCGVVLGSVLVVLFWIMSWYTGQLIVRCSSPPISGGLNYATLSYNAFGEIGVVIVEVSTILFVLGACVGYLVIIGDVITPYINLLFYVDRRLVMLFFGGLFCFPLSCLRRISTLKYTSFAALILIFYLVVCVIVNSALGMTSVGLTGTVALANFDASFLSVLPIIAFAFSFHPNVPLIWSEMSEFSEENFAITVSVGIATSVCCVVYLACGIFGYLSFFENTTDNLLKQFPIGEVYLDVGKLGYALIIIFSYPLLAYPLRASFDSMVNRYYYKDEQRPVSTFRLILEAFVIFCISLGLAVLPIGIGVVFGITGSTAGTLLMVALPAAFVIILDIEEREKYYSWSRRYFSRRKIVPIFLLLLSCVLIITGLYSVVVYQLLPGFEQGIGGA